MVNAGLLLKTATDVVVSASPRVASFILTETPLVKFTTMDEVKCTKRKPKKKKKT